MSLKELLVSVDASTSGLERMRFALDLARSHDAYLTAYYSSPTVSESSEGSPGEMAEAIEQQFETELTARHLKGGWMLSGDPIVEDLVDRIKYTDLAILGLGSPGSGEPDPQGFKISDVVLSCGRPLLATSRKQAADEVFQGAGGLEWQLRGDARVARCHSPDEGRSKYLDHLDRP